MDTYSALFKVLYSENYSTTIYESLLYHRLFPSTKWYVHHLPTFCSLPSLSCPFLRTNGARGFPARNNLQELPCPNWQQPDHYPLGTESATAAAD